MAHPWRPQAQEVTSAASHTTHKLPGCRGAVLSHTEPTQERLTSLLPGQSALPSPLHPGTWSLPWFQQLLSLTSPVSQSSLSHAGVPPPLGCSGCLELWSAIPAQAEAAAPSTRCSDSGYRKMVPPAQPHNTVPTCPHGPCLSCEQLAEKKIKH